MTGHRAVGLACARFLGHWAWLEDGFCVDQRRPWTGWPCKLREGLSWGGRIPGLGSSRALMAQRGQRKVYFVRLWGGQSSQHLGCRSVPAAASGIGGAHLSHRGSSGNK